VKIPAVGLQKGSIIMGTQARKIDWKPASTVILVREKGPALQVYLLKRSAASSFFPGWYVFPGGAVEPEDHIAGPWQPHADLTRLEISKKFGPDLDLNGALAYCVSAIRETFEEAGIFLGYAKDQNPASLGELCQRRVKTGLPKNWFWPWVVSQQWILRFSRLSPWARWITPELMHKHFDTRFFVAVVPEGQSCMPDNRETALGIWTGIEEALTGNLRGTLPLTPPTLVTLHELLNFGCIKDLEKALATRSWGEKRFPRLVPLAKGAVVLQSWDPMRHEAVEINPENLEKALLPVGAPFSRMWLDKGCWKPVAIL
jgi:8-oxo-dGTP pyrophosphatase MutT (NUDIX family)